MRNSVLLLLISLLAFSCKTAKLAPEAEAPVVAYLDLVNVNDDKVQVTIDPDRFSVGQTTFYLPRIVPGHYDIDDFGRFVENFKAYDYDGREMQAEYDGESSWTIPNAKDLDKVSYLVNDTYDMENEGGTFSPSGTNINSGENFMLNLHGFVGYFKGEKEEAYVLEVKRPKTLISGSALTAGTTSINEEVARDEFKVDRYFEITDHPIMYSKPDTASIKVDGMEVLLDVYSPNGVTSAEKLMPVIERTIRAQKNFLGDIDNTSKYAILLYLSDQNRPDARGLGALEHHTSTVVTLTESLPEATLERIMTDVVSHEFFHILTPLNLHSKEIHYFDYNDPKMSQHLWMYEGVTEYFANLFQVREGLINKAAFYDRMMSKIQHSQQYDDEMPFTEMSENVLDEQYGKNYLNVYQKGALIGMALDIKLRELSEGKTGILDLMKRLSQKYGKDHPFDDEKIIDEIVAMTSPEIGEFFETYVSGTTPIPYNEFFEKVGLEVAEVEKESSYFNRKLPDDNPNDFLTVNKEKFVVFNENAVNNSFLKALGIKGGDVLLSVNGTKYKAENAFDLMQKSADWEAGKDIKVTIRRNGEQQTLQQKAFPPTRKTKVLREKELPANDPKVKLRQAWLKG